MSNITPDLVQELAELAKLELTAEEVEKITAELSNIFAMIEQINAFDTDGVEPTAQVTGLTHVTRPDKVSDYKTAPDDLLKAASVTENRQLKVPYTK